MARRGNRGAYQTTWPNLPMTHSIQETSLVGSQHEAKERAGDTKDTKVALTRDFGGGYLPPAKNTSDTHFVIDFFNKQTPKFLFKVTGIAGKTVRIDLKNVAGDAMASPTAGRRNSLNLALSYVSDLGPRSRFAVVPVKDPAAPTAAYNGRPISQTGFGVPP